MALMKCPECEREISDQAKICPHCGHPIAALQAALENSVKEKKRERKKTIWLIILFILVTPILYGIIFGIHSGEQKKHSQVIVKFAEPPLVKSESINKSAEIALWIESKVNTDSYNGCQCKSLSPDLVKCNLYFPAGTNTLSVEADVKGVAELFAQVDRLATTIYYVGFSGNQKVCEYKYDMYDATITKIK